jgi:hypothetical protein
VEAVECDEMRVGIDDTAGSNQRKNPGQSDQDRHRNGQGGMILIELPQQKERDGRDERDNQRHPVQGGRNLAVDHVEDRDADKEDCGHQLAQNHRKPTQRREGPPHFWRFLEDQKRLELYFLLRFLKLGPAQCLTLRSVPDVDAHRIFLIRQKYRLNRQRQSAAL